MSTARLVFRSRSVTVMPPLPAYLANNPVLASLGGDEEFAELIEMFVSALPSRRDRLVTAFDEQDQATVERIAHQLKGAAGGYGFPELSQAAGRLHDAVRAGDVVGMVAEMRMTVEQLNTIEQAATSDVN